MRVLFVCLLACASLWAQPPAKAKPKPVPVREPGPYATLATSMGTIVVRLFEKDAPITVRNFIELARGIKPYTDPNTGQRLKKPFYNGLIFHRVIPGFMIQTGDPTGSGLHGSDPIPDEILPTLTFDRPGRLAMANKGPQTGSSQFFITEAAQPRLDGRYTIFGQLVSGQDVVSKIANVPRGERDRPFDPPKLLRVTITQSRPAATPAKRKPVAKPVAK